jgi:Putative regulator of cell autolysis
MQMINVAINTYSIIVLVVLILYFANNKRLHIRLNRYFIYMCICNILMTLGDNITMLFEGRDKVWYPMAAWWGMLIHFIFAGPLLFISICYIAEYLSRRAKISKAFVSVSFALTTIYVVGILFAQTNGMFYYFNEQNIYVRGEWFLFKQVIPFAMQFIGAGTLIYYRKYMRKKDFIALLIYIALTPIAGAIQIMNYGIALVNITITISLLLIFTNTQSEQELLVEEQEKELVESRIDTMLSQIKPHFLYNTLTTIGELCDLEPKVAKGAIRDFSFFLRANMDSLTNKAPIPFMQELEHVKNYLRLEKQRFRERLHVVYDIRVEDFSIPPLCVQPIAENAVRHGTMKREEGGTVTIRSEETKTAYVITITDDGIGFDENAPRVDDGETHVGIANVKSRLQMMTNGTLSIKSVRDKGTTVTITIFKESEEDE